MSEDSAAILHALKDATLEITNISARVSHLEKQLRRTEAIEKSGALGWCVDQLNLLIKGYGAVTGIVQLYEQLSAEIKDMKIKIGLEKAHVPVCSLCEGSGVLEEIYLCPKCDGLDRDGSHIN